MKAFWRGFFGFFGNLHYIFFGLSGVALFCAKDWGAKEAAIWLLILAVYNLVDKKFSKLENKILELEAFNAGYLRESMRELHRKMSANNQKYTANDKITLEY